MMLNCGKTKELCVCFTRKPPEVSPIVTDSRKIEVVSSATLLSVVFSDNLTWRAYMDHITSKAAQRLYFSRGQQLVDPKTLVHMYVALVCPVVEYACQVWHAGLTRVQSKQLGSIQHRALDIVFLDATYRQACGLVGLVTLEECRENACRTFLSSHAESQPQIASPAACCQGEGAWH